MKTRSTVRQTVLRSAALAVAAGTSPLALSVPAHAQTAVEADTEIVVTAQRREQRLQDVPISITAMTAETLESAGFQQTSDVVRAIPNVNFTAGRGLSASANLVIRGVGSAVDEVDQPVAVYLDEVFMANNGMFNMNIVDLERIEVLRGPQGTLYGRNAMAGAVNFISARPSDEFEGSLQATYGSYEYLQGRAMLNIPLSDTLAIRANIASTTRDGIVDRVGMSDRTNTIDNLGARLQVRWDASERLSFLLAGDWSRDDAETTALAPISLARRGQTDIPIPYAEDREIDGAMLRATYDFGGAEFVSITSQRGLSSYYLGSDFLPVLLAMQWSEVETDQFSQEFRLASTGSGPLSWVGGVYYFEEEKLVVNGYDTGPGIWMLFGAPAAFIEQSRSNVPIEAIAAYANVSYEFSPNFTLTIGARYGEEEKELEYEHLNDLGFGAFAPMQTLNATRTFTNFMPMINASYHFNEDLMIYATASEGGKSGGFNFAFLPTPVDSDGNPIASPTNQDIVNNFSFDPESVFNYEIGLKSTSADGRIVFSGALFYMDWRDQQVTAFNGFTNTTSNVEESRSYGLEVDVLARVTPDLDVQLGIGIVDATFQRGIASIPGMAAVNVEGLQQPNMSPLTGSLAINYEPHLDNGWRMPMRMDVSYRSHHYFSFVNDMQLPSPSNPANLLDFGDLSQDGYALVNLRLGLENDSWGFTLFANNVFDERYITSGQWCTNCTSLNDFGVFTPPNLADDFSAAIGDRRTIGITANYRF